jgi:hypothetical protein
MTRSTARRFQPRPFAFLYLFLFSLCVLCVLRGESAFANPPAASFIFPAGGQRGTTVKVRVGGLYLYKSCSFELLGTGVEASKQLRSTRTLWFEGPLLPLPASQQAEDYPRDMAGEIRIAADASLGARRGRVWTAEGAASGLQFLVGDLPEIIEDEIDGDPIAVDVKLPGTINGRIFPREDVDDWAFTASKGQRITAEVCAARLGSPLDSRLEVFDPHGHKIAENDDADGADSRVRFIAPEQGKYRLRIHDVNQQGGPAYVYRLTVTTDRVSSSEGQARRSAPLALQGKGAPDFQVHPARDTVTLPRGGQVKLHIVAERQGGFAGPITLRIAGLPAGITVSNTTLAAGQTATDLTFATTAFASLGAAHLTLRGEALIEGQTVTRTATLPAARGESPIDSLLLVVAMKAPFKIVGAYDLRLAPRGSVFHRRYKIERHGFDGPLEVSLADHQMRHLQGVTGPTITVPPGANEFEYAVQLPPWMETGRTSRACIMAVGVIRTDGVEHTVGYSSEGQNDQVIAVVETGRLGLDIDRQSLAAVRGGQATVTVKVSRGKGLTGPVKLELVLPQHMRGVSAAPVVMPADQARATFTLRFASSTLGPFNMPVVLRATLSAKAGSVLAETKLEIVPEK